MLMDRVVQFQHDGAGTYDFCSQNAFDRYGMWAESLRRHGRGSTRRAA